MGAYIKVARITKARKRQGRLVVQSCDGLPFLLESGMTVHIVPPELDLPRTLVVGGVWEGEDDAIAFDGVSDYPSLVRYVGKYCLVNRADINPDLLQAPAALHGFTVLDERFGELGRVDDVLEGPSQFTLVLNGPHGEVMVPAVDEFLRDVDVDAGVIRTHVPNGLVEVPDAD